MNRAEAKLLPRELNPYERMRVRWAFATWKLALLIPAGVVFGWLFMAGQR